MLGPTKTLTVAATVEYHLALVAAARSILVANAAQGDKILKLTHCWRANMPIILVLVHMWLMVPLSKSFWMLV